MPEGPSKRVADACGDRPFHIVTFGDPDIDQVFSTARVPLADQKVPGRKLGSFAGGTTANAACAAAKLGLRVAAYGRVGNDGDGRFLLAENDAFGVSNAFMRVVEQPTATSLIIVDHAGEKALVFAPMDREPLDEERFLEVARQTRIVYTMPRDLQEHQKVSQLARSAGAEIAVDIEAPVAPTREHLEAILTMSDIVFLNEGGFRATSDAPITAEALRPLLAYGPRVVVVTLGAGGAIGVTREDEACQPAFEVDVVDATGAGDCFNAAFLAADLRGSPLAEALEFACAAAAIAVGAVGARSGLPTKDDVEQNSNSKVGACSKWGTRFAFPDMRPLSAKVSDG
ncbi:MAG: carbohydrate kinase family protein [Mesorhizobium sp.]